MNTFRKTALACLVAGLCASAWAQVPPPVNPSGPANPFVAQATSPGFAPVANAPSAIPAPPTPPSSLGIPAQIRPPSDAQAQAQATRQAFGLAQGHPVREPHKDLLANGLIEHARPGQTLQAPALPNMPPVPDTSIPQPIPLAAGSVGIAGPQMSLSDVITQTKPVNSLKFTVQEGSTYRMTMSSAAPNMLQTPFEHPKLLVANKSAVNFFQHGRSLLVTVADGAPIGAYITGQDPQDPMIALVFQPRPVPPQNYEMNIEGFVAKQGSSEAADVITGTSEEHTQRVVRLLEQAMQRRIPDGFGALSSRHWPQARSQAGLMVQPSLVLSSGSEMVDVFEVTNQTSHAVQLEENDFYRQGVEGVALSQHTPLEPGQSLKAYILRRATHADASDTLMSVSRP